MPGCPGTWHNSDVRSSLYSVMLYGKHHSWPKPRPELCFNERQPCGHAWVFLEGPRPQDLLSRLDAVWVRQTRQHSSLRHLHCTTVLPARSTTVRMQMMRGCLQDTALRYCCVLSSSKPVLVEESKEKLSTVRPEHWARYPQANTYDPTALNPPGPVMEGGLEMRQLMCKADGPEAHRLYAVVWGLGFTRDSQIGLR